MIYLVDAIADSEPGWLLITKRNKPGAKYGRVQLREGETEPKAVQRYMEGFPGKTVCFWGDEAKGEYGIEKEV